MDDLTKQLSDLKAFKDYLDYIGSESCPLEELDDLYNRTINITLNGHIVHIPFDAENYHNLLNLITIAIKEF